MSSSNPYTDRMNEIARLRNQALIIQNQIGDEIAKAWRLAPVNNMEVFASNLGMTQDDVQAILESRGIVQRTQVVPPPREI